MGYIVCQAKHKPTGNIFPLLIYINQVFIGLGVESIEDPVHDRESLWTHSMYVPEETDNGIIQRLYPSVESSTVSMGYNSAHQYTSYTTNEIDNYLSNDYFGVYISRSHGGRRGTTNNPPYTYIQIDEENLINYTSARLLSLSDNALSNLQLAIFGGCYTGTGGVGGNNLPSAAVEKGATTAIGFKNTVKVNLCNYWTMGVMQQLAQGYTIQNACATVSARKTFEGTGLALTNCVICGDPYYKLNPGTIS